MIEKKELLNHLLQKWQPSCDLNSANSKVALSTSSLGAGKLFANGRFYGLGAPSALGEWDAIVRHLLSQGFVAEKHVKPEYCVYDEAPNADYVLQSSASESLCEKYDGRTLNDCLLRFPNISVPNWIIDWAKKEAFPSVPTLLQFGDHGCNWASVRFPFGRLHVDIEIGDQSVKFCCKPQTVIQYQEDQKTVPSTLEIKSAIVYEPIQSEDDVERFVRMIADALNLSDTGPVVNCFYYLGSRVKDWVRSYTVYKIKEKFKSMDSRIKEVIYSPYLGHKFEVRVENPATFENAQIDNESIKVAKYEKDILYRE
jgi:hypothetical protein